MPENAAHWIALLNCPGVGPVVFRSLADRFGGPGNVFAAGRPALEGVSRLRRETIDALLHPARLITASERIVERLENDGVTVLTMRDSTYPPGLLDLKDPPPVLYTIGELPGADARAFSVAGTTQPSDRGAQIARAAGQAMAEAGWTVVSGYAPGVDTAAHLGSLERDGRTALVLPTGIRTFRLRSEFEPFRDEVGRNIALVSEYGPDDGWSGAHAVRRDRLIAAMGRALLAVEARAEGGTMITFRHAIRLGRPAYVVKYRRAPAGAAGNRLAVQAGGLPVESMAALRQIVRAAKLPGVAPRPRQGELF